MPSVVFRVDASLDIGTGHVMRCLTLAKALRQAGADCRFVTRLHQGHGCDVIRKQGFEVLPMPAAGKVLSICQPHGPVHAGWLGSSQVSDADATLALLPSSVDWLVVDHYALDASWESVLRQRVSKILVIDDLADRRHDADWLLDQNLGRVAADYDGLVSRDCVLRLGPFHALLRPEFAEYRAASLARLRDAKPSRILISMGGVDQSNATGRILAALSRCDLSDQSNVTVVLGAGAPWIGDVKEQLASFPCTFELKVDAPNMAALLAETDLAIGAAGTSAWERCCLGVPTLTAIVADNQRGGAHALSAAGCTELLDEADPFFNELPEKIELMAMPGYLSAKQATCAALTDGLGAFRLAEDMLRTE